ncbi:MAG: hypothetical protein JWN98_1001 [Abditibacteriota bacterium]|nr:hypothetical protein [Abditibacteriota bacterium]
MFAFEARRLHGKHLFRGVPLRLVGQLQCRPFAHFVFIRDLNAGIMDPC